MLHQTAKVITGTEHTTQREENMYIKFYEFNIKSTLLKITTNIIVLLALKCHEVSTWFMILRGLCNKSLPSYKGCCSHMSVLRSNAITLKRWYQRDWSICSCVPFFDNNIEKIKTYWTALRGNEFYS